MSGVWRFSVKAFLQDLGFGGYAEAFETHFVDEGVLLKLTADDLTAMGVTAIGYRRRLLEAIEIPDQGHEPWKGHRDRILVRMTVEQFLSDPVDVQPMKGIRRLRVLPPTPIVDPPAMPPHNPPHPLT